MTRTGLNVGLVIALAAVFVLVEVGAGRPAHLIALELAVFAAIVFVVTRRRR